MPTPEHVPWQAGSDVARNISEAMFSPARLEKGITAMMEEAHRQTVPDMAALEMGVPI